MSTPWDEVNSIFYDKIEKDRDFFDYFGLGKEEAINLARIRADSCLKEAAVHLALACTADVNFVDYDISLRQFNFDASPVEKELMASLQYEAYMERDIAKLKVMNLNFTPTELQVFSPSNDRKTFMQMFEAIKQENAWKIDAYNSRNRLDNTRLAIDYTAFDES